MPRRLLALLVGVGFALVTALPASAHVVVDPTAVPAGSEAVLTFRVPNESAKAATDEVTLTIPADHPFASVSVLKQPGWTATLTRTALTTPLTDDDGLTISQAVTRISWQADASAKLALGEFAEFTIEVGPVPDGVGSLTLPVAQGYDDGSVVDWNETAGAGGPEPEHPAPVLRVVPAAAAGSGAPSAVPDPPRSGAPSAASASTPSAGGSAPAGPSSSGPADPTVTVVRTESAPASAQAAAARADNAARILAVVATLIGALALLVGALAVRRRRSRSGS